MKKWLVVVSFLLIAGLSSLSAQESSALYRGKYPPMYPFKYNGHVFWETKDYTPGNIRYNGKEYVDVLMNIDAYKQDIQIIPPGTQSIVVLYRDQIAWVSIKDELYVNLQYLGWEDVPAGFYKVLKDGPRPILYQVKKYFATSTSNQNRFGIGYKDPNYDVNLIHYFRFEDSYFALDENGLQRISKSKARKLIRQENDGQPLISPLLDVWHTDPNPTGTLSSSEEIKPAAELPAGYFSEIQDDSLTVQYASHAQTASYKNKIYTIGEPLNSKKTAKVTGHVIEFETDDPLYGAIVFDDNTDAYCTTDQNGFYSLNLPKGENTLHFIYESKEELELQVIIEGDGSLDVMLNDQVTLLKEAVISASSMEKHRTTALGIESISTRFIGKIPSAFGEGDVVRAVLTLPGIKSVGEASGGFNVLGGSAGENLILFNENTIYNPSHLFGIFSSFNPDIISGVDIYKSSVPAEYGGRLSSVMKVTSKEGDPQRIRGSLGIGLLTSRAQIEGPIIKNKTTLVLGGRATYSDWLLKELPTNSAYAGAQANFFDVNAGLTHRFTASDILQLSFYYASDRFNLVDNVTNSYTNLNGSVIFRHKGNDSPSWQIAGGYDRYTNQTGDHSWPYAAYDLTTQINQAFLKGWWKNTFDQHEVSFGGQVIDYIMEPGIREPFGSVSVLRDRLDQENGIEPAVFVSDLFNISDEFSLEAGARLLGFVSQKDNRVYLGPEFRLSGKYSPSETLSIKAGFNSMRQNIHLISNTSGISPMDTWKLSDSSIKPASGWQGSAGVYWTLISLGLDFSAEAYWKQSVNSLDYRAGAQLAMNENLAEDLIPIRTRAYGTEFMIKKPTGQLTGWISYTYSRALFREMYDRGIETIAGGDWYNAPYDKPHEFKMVANWAMTHRFSLSANVDYSTGRPVTVPVGTYFYKGGFRVAYSDRNVHRIPDYFRVDLALNIDPGHYMKAIAHSSITVGVYNVLGRKNPYSVYFSADQNGRMKGHMLSIFAQPVPYVNFNLMF